MLTALNAASTTAQVRPPGDDPLELPVRPGEGLPPDRLAAGVALMETMSGEWVLDWRLSDATGSKPSAGAGLESIQSCCNGYWIGQTLQARAQPEGEKAFTMIVLSGYDAVTGRFVRVVVGGPFPRPVTLTGQYSESERLLLLESAPEPFTGRRWICRELFIEESCRRVTYEVAEGTEDERRLDLLLWRRGALDSCMERVPR
jgi:hypothetical protein